MTILVIGESIMDIVDDDGRQSQFPGGSPANVALGLGRLGEDVLFHSQLGRDGFGQEIAQHLQHSGVRISESSWGPAPTSRGLARIQPDGSAAYSFDITWSPQPPPVVPFSLLHTGSVAAALEPGCDVVAAGMRAARARGRTVTFDPNVRRDLYEDESRARARLMSLAGLADVVKLSDEDAAWLLPGASIDAVIDAFIARGAALVAVTAGDGAHLATRRTRLHQPAEPVHPVDTIGAGDTFMARLISCIVAEPVVLTPEVDEAALRGVVGSATAAAAITVQRRGADLPWLSDLPARTLEVRDGSPAT